MASNTFTIEICDEDRRRIDALVEALKKSEGLSKLLEQRDPKLSVVVAHCEHRVIAHDIDDGATCSKCGRDLGWFCHISPKHYGFMPQKSGEVRHMRVQVPSESLIRWTSRITWHGDKEIELGSTARC